MSDKNIKEYSQLCDSISTQYPDLTLVCEDFKEKYAEDERQLRKLRKTIHSLRFLLMFKKKYRSGKLIISKKLKEELI